MIIAPMDFNLIVEEGGTIFENGHLKVVCSINFVPDAKLVAGSTDRRDGEVLSCPMGADQISGAISN